MIGIDIIGTKRFRNIRKKDYTFWSKSFSKREWEYAFGRPSPEYSLAGIFAAKEAALKACKMESIEGIKQVEIRYSKNGAPYAMVGKNKSTVLVSISHDEGVAVAVALVP